MYSMPRLLKSENRFEGRPGSKPNVFQKKTLQKRPNNTPANRLWNKPENGVQNRTKNRPETGCNETINQVKTGEKTTINRIKNNMKKRMKNLIEKRPEWTKQKTGWKQSRKQDYLIRTRPFLSEFNLNFRLRLRGKRFVCFTIVWRQN